MIVFVQNVLQILIHVNALKSFWSNDVVLAPWRCSMILQNFEPRLPVKRDSDPECLIAGCGAMQVWRHSFPNAARSNMKQRCHWCSFLELWNTYGSTFLCMQLCEFNIVYVGCFFSTIYIYIGTNSELNRVSKRCRSRMWICWNVAWLTMSAICFFASWWHCSCWENSCCHKYTANEARFLHLWEVLFLVPFQEQAF